MDAEFNVSPDNTVLDEGNTPYVAVNTGIAGNTNYHSDNGFVYDGTFSALWNGTTGQTLINRFDLASLTNIIDHGIAIRPQGTPNANTAILWVSASATSTVRASVRILSDGTIQMRQASSSVWDSVANGFGTKIAGTNLNRWWFIEHVVTATTQRVKVWDDTQTLIEDSGNITYNGSTFDQAFGGSQSSFWTCSYDRHIIRDDSSFLIGPRVVASNWTRTITEQLGLTDSLITEIVAFLLQNDFEAVGMIGAAFTAGETGYDNLTGQWARDQVLHYNGTQSARLNYANNNGLALKSFTSAQAHVYNGWAENFNTRPDTVTTISQVEDAAGTILGRVRINALGGIVIDNGTTTVYTQVGPTVFTLVGPTRKWYWLEHFVEADQNRQKFQIYDYAANLVLDTGWQTYTGGNVSRAKIGFLNNCTVDASIDKHRIAIGVPTGPVAQPNDFAQNLAELESLVDSMTVDQFRTLLESMGLSDTLQISSSTQWAANPNDVMALADSILVGTHNTFLTQQDAVGISELDDGFQIVNETQTDALGLADSLVVQRGILAADITDDTGLTDSLIVGKNYGTQVDDSAGLVDSVSVLQGFAQNRQVDDSENLIDSLQIGHGRTPTDDMTLRDSLVTNKYTLTPTITDLLGLEDVITTIKNGVPVVSLSKADQVAAALRALGYTGSIQDMQYKYLLDKYTQQFGAPTKALSSADMQLKLGYQVEDLLNLSNISSLTNAWTVAQTDLEGLTDTPLITGIFEPKEILSSQDQSAGSTAITASVTLKAGRLYHLVVTGFPTTGGTAADPTGVQHDSNNTAFTKIGSVLTANGNCDLSIWAIDGSSPSGAGTITITFAASQNVIQWKLIELAGSKITGAGGFGGRKQAIVSAQNAATTPSAALGSAPTAGDIEYIAIVYNAASANTITAGAGTPTLLGSNLQGASDAVQLAIGYKISALATTLGFNTTNASGKAMLICELEAA